jgi:hypothetical protein
MISLDINEDLTNELKVIHDNSFPFPNINNFLYISKKVIVEDNEIIAAGFLKLTSEGILITNPRTSRRSRVLATKELINILELEAKKFGFDDCHVFVKDSKVQEFLRHLGFNFCKGGTPMIIQF